MTAHTKHSNHEVEPAWRDIQKTFLNIPQVSVLALIRLYQVTISRVLPSGTCRFHPTCSHYGYQAIAKYGLMRGGWMAFKRILRCQPFNPGGFDPVP
jgi:putative membrane protein insertion efficiency factor